VKARFSGFHPLATALFKRGVVRLHFVTTHRTGAVLDDPTIDTFGVKKVTAGKTFYLAADFVGFQADAAFFVGVVGEIIFRDSYYRNGPSCSFAGRRRAVVLRLDRLKEVCHGSGRATTGGSRPDAWEVPHYGG
jgi:hypothetical protein